MRNLLVSSLVMENRLGYCNIIILHFFYMEEMKGKNVEKYQHKITLSVQNLPQ